MELRVLQVNDALEGGGAELVFRRTSELLKEQGIPTAAYYGRKNPAPTLKDLPGYLFSLKHYLGIRKKIREFHPNIVHLHNIYHKLSPGILLALRHLKPKYGFSVVITLHDYHLLCANNAYIRWIGQKPEICEECNYGRFYKILVKRCDPRNFVFDILKFLQHEVWYNMMNVLETIDLFIAPSRFLHLKHQLLLPDRPIMTVHNPAFELEEQMDEINRIAESVPGGYKSIFIGRLTPEKGMIHFIRDTYSFELFGKMAVVGSGDREYVTRLNRLITEKNLSSHIDVIGPLDHLTAMAYLSRSETLVFPSLWYENCPLIILEAQYLGKNIFFYQHGATPEVIASTSDNRELLRETVYVRNLISAYWHAMQSSPAAAADEEQGE